MWLHADGSGSPDSQAFRHCGQSFSLLGFITRGADALLDFFDLVNHFKIDLDWKNIEMKADYSQAEFMILFLGMTAILSYPPPLSNYQLPSVAIPKL